VSAGTTDPPATRDEQAAAWCVRFADAALPPAERRALAEWIDRDPANAAALEEAVAIWQAADAANATPEMIRFRAEAVSALRDANARRWRRRPTFGAWSWHAAVAACLTLIVAGLLFINNRAGTYATDIGERRIVRLEDGTRLTLDAASKVEVRMEPDRRRLRLIAGRAKFDVARDPLRPFSVRAGGRVAVATGTSFSVELLPGQMRVVLYEGTVEVLDSDAGGAVQRPHPGVSAPATTLTPGKELIASTVDARHRIVDADTERSLAWESGSLSFDREPLALAAERVNRNAATRLVVADPAIRSYRVSGVFAAGDVDAFVEGVSALYPVAATEHDGAIILTRMR
jgi:transmembrane sensor